MAIPKPGKPDCTQVRAHRVISLLDSISKLAKRTAAHPTADNLERRDKLSTTGSTVAGNGGRRWMWSRR